jgi:RNA polymerase sigma-70 factor, ECF subfamily
LSVLSALLARLHRDEGGKIVATLIRQYGSFDIAEDALQDALEKAVTRWRNAPPSNPAAWLMATARNAAIDRLRRDSRSVQLESEEMEALLDAQADHGVSEHVDPTAIEDDRLRLIFTCCHPSLSQPAAAALALRTLCGLTTAQIARAFVEPEATTAQKIVRIKRKIADARIPYQVPEEAELPERLTSVLAVIYLVFNEGYLAAQGASLTRTDLCTEAIRLARLLCDLLPQEPECLGLLALMTLHHARRDARVDAAGAMISLEEQDRKLWHADELTRGLGHAKAALRARKPGPYQIQAAIAAVHSEAKEASQTDWTQVVGLYRTLYRRQPTIIVELNGLVAQAMAGLKANDVGLVDQALAQLRALGSNDELNGYHLLPASIADLLRRLGRLDEAREQYKAALALVQNERERAYLQRRLDELLSLNSG